MKGMGPNRTLGRDSEHRRSLLRNLVTQLFKHERISTTFAKAKEAQRMADKMITKAKKGHLEQKGRQVSKVESFVFEINTVRPIVQSLAERYAARPGGYTRLIPHGSRLSDAAPRALLELVDQPRGDLKLKMTAMAMGRELYKKAKGRGPEALSLLASSIGRVPIEHDELYEERTRVNAAKVVQFAGETARKQLAEGAREHLYRLMASQQVFGAYRVDEDKVAMLRKVRMRGSDQITHAYATPPMTGMRRLVGMSRDDIETGPEEPPRKLSSPRNSPIRIAKGAYARRVRPRVITFSSKRRLAIARQGNAIRNATIANRSAVSRVVARAP